MGITVLVITTKINHKPVRDQLMIYFPLIPINYNNRHLEPIDFEVFRNPHIFYMATCSQVGTILNFFYISLRPMW
jgi:hypothetical protein